MEIIKRTDNTSNGGIVLYRPHGLRQYTHLTPPRRDPLPGVLSDLQSVFHEYGEV